MNPIQYTCVFRGVVLVREPVKRPKAQVEPLPPPKPVARPPAALASSPVARLVTVA